TGLAEPNWFRVQTLEVYERPSDADPKGRPGVHHTPRPHRHNAQPGAKSGPLARQTSNRPLIRLVLECTLKSLPSLLAGLSGFALALHRGLFVVHALFHLLKEAVLKHLFLELLEGGLNLVVNHLDLHSAKPQMTSRSTMGLLRD